MTKNKKNFTDSLNEVLVEGAKKTKGTKVLSTTKIEPELQDKVRIIAYQHRINQKDLTSLMLERYVEKYEALKGPIKPKPTTGELPPELP